MFKKPISQNVLNIDMFNFKRAQKILVLFKIAPLVVTMMSFQRQVRNPFFCCWKTYPVQTTWSKHTWTGLSVVHGEE
jgi:hypothetical protein